MTRPRRSAPGIAFAAARTGLFQSGSGEGPPERETLDIVAVGRNVEASRRWRRATTLVGGAALVAFAFVPRGVVGAFLGLSGVLLLARGIAGRPLAETAKLVGEKLQARTRNEKVDRASEQSFPASDPPSHSPSRA